MGSTIVEFIIDSDLENEDSESGNSSVRVTSRESSPEPQPGLSNGGSGRQSLPEPAPVKDSCKLQSSGTAPRHSGRLADPDYKSFACSLCQQCFNFKFELLRHKMSHYEKPKRTQLPSAAARWRVKLTKHRGPNKGRGTKSSSKNAKGITAIRKKPTEQLNDSRLLTPLDQGWTRLVIYRPNSEKQVCDTYYQDPEGRKYRSLNELAQGKFRNGLSLDNFSFARRPLDLKHSKEIVRRSGSAPQVAKSSLESPVKKEASKTKTTPPPEVPSKNVRWVDGSGPSQPAKVVPRTKAKTTQPLTVPSEGFPSRNDGADQKFLLPLNHGWVRLVVGRRKNKDYDIYYLNPEGRKYRSYKDISNEKFKKGITLENFTFKRCPLGLKHPREIIRTPGSKSRTVPKPKTTPLPKVIPKSEGFPSHNDGADQKFLLPLNHGWVRLVVGRRKNSGYDIYYLNPEGRKFRSHNDIRKEKFKKGITLENFTFKRCPLGFKHPREIIRTPGSKSRTGPKPKTTPRPKVISKSEEISTRRETLPKFKRSPIATRKIRTPNPRLADGFETSLKAALVRRLISESPPKIKSSSISPRKIGSPSSKTTKMVKTPSIIKKTEASNVEKDVSDQQFLPPLNQGWSRLVVYRREPKTLCDIYYLNPAGKKIRSMKELGSEKFNDKRGKGLTLGNFSFVRRPLDVDHPKQIVQKAGNLQRREVKKSSPVRPLCPLSSLLPKRSRSPAKRRIRTTSDPKLDFMSQLDLDSIDLQPRVVLEDIMLKRLPERNSCLTGSEELVDGCSGTQSADGDEGGLSRLNSPDCDCKEAATSESGPNLLNDDVGEGTALSRSDSPSSDGNKAATSQSGQNLLHDGRTEETCTNSNTPREDELCEGRGDESVDDHEPSEAHEDLTGRTEETSSNSKSAGEDKLCEGRGDKSFDDHEPSEAHEDPTGRTEETSSYSNAPLEDILCESHVDDHETSGVHEDPTGVRGETSSNLKATDEDKICDEGGSDDHESPEAHEGLTESINETSLLESDVAAPSPYRDGETETGNDVSNVRPREEPKLPSSQCDAETDDDSISNEDMGEDTLWVSQPDPEGEQ